ncbi:MAG: preprotein translocase subunit SecF [Frankiales bacterium]|nr:preprotein translocase subunit SecF [Frankiales bacterium]
MAADGDNNWGARLYTGEKSYNVVGRRRTWYAISGLIVLVCALALVFRPLNLGIEFKGGDVFEFPSKGHSVSDARDLVAGLGHPNPIVTKNSQGVIRVQTEPIEGPTAEQEVKQIQTAIGAKFGLDPNGNDISVQQVGPTWGDQITKKAITSLIVFLVFVVGFITVRFEFKMAISALVALLHDVVITIGVYSIAGFEVTPATVIGLLTILGYSLYDTVVVFDKVRENTAGIVGGNRMTYSQAANLALNQTLVRSINTSVIALLPVAGILFIGAFVLGAGTLKDLSLALFVGLAAGTYSSIFIATPLLADLKEREPQMKLLARRVDARISAGKAAGATAGVAAAAAPATVRARTATAVLDRDDDGDDDDADEPAPATTTERRATQGGGQQQRRAQQQRRRKSKSSRPKGGRKKRR